MNWPAVLVNRHLSCKTFFSNIFFWWISLEKCHPNQSLMTSESDVSFRQQRKECERRGCFSSDALQVFGEEKIYSEMWFPQPLGQFSALIFNLLHLGAHSGGWAWPLTPPCEGVLVNRSSHSWETVRKERESGCFFKERKHFSWEIPFWLSLVGHDSKWVVGPLTEGSPHGNML